MRTELHNYETTNLTNLMYKSQTVQATFMNLLAKTKSISKKMILLSLKSELVSMIPD